MITVPRPLPIAIVLMGVLTGVKMVGLAQAVGVGSPAHANTQPRGESPAPRAAGSEEKPKPAAEQKPPAGPQPPAEPPMSESERSALQDLRERRKQLDGQASKLDERESILSAAEQRINERLKQLTALQTKLEQLDKIRHDREEANWKGLVKTYETMRPRDAANIFNDLDNAIMIQVLDRMKEAKAGAILAAMSPERARSATTQLAQYRSQGSAAPHLDAQAGQHQ